jgi:hypothetical protein
MDTHGHFINIFWLTFLTFLLHDMVFFLAEYSYHIFSFWQSIRIIRMASNVLTLTNVTSLLMRILMNLLSVMFYFCLFL